MAGSPADRRSILLVVHGLPPEEHTGTPLAALGYARELASRDWDVTVLYGSEDPESGWADRRPARRRRGDEGFSRVAAPRTPWRGPVWGRRAPAFPADPGRNPSDAAFLALLAEVRPDVVHVVDAVDLPLSWPELCRAVDVPAVRTVACAEDLCAMIAPVSPRSGPSGYCAAPITPEGCASCIQAAMRPPAGVPVAGMPGAERGVAERCVTERGVTERGVADRWRLDELTGLLSVKRERARRQYRGVFDKVVFASAAFRAYFEATLPLDPSRVAVVPMGIDGVPGAAASARDRRVPPRRSGEPLRFVMAATLHEAKGIEAVVDAFTSSEVAARHAEWRLHLAGGGDGALVAGLASSPSTVRTGAYTPAELPALLARADVGISASVFETFHRVTREYLSSGLAVLGSTAFGITDAVVHERNGLLFDHAEPGSLARCVLRLLDDPDLVGRLREGASRTPVRSVAEEVSELEAIYAEVTDRRSDRRSQIAPPGFSSMLGSSASTISR